MSSTIEGASNHHTSLQGQASALKALLDLGSLNRASKTNNEPKASEALHSARTMLVKDWSVECTGNKNKKQLSSTAENTWRASKQRCNFGRQVKI
jgi:hypothetical protein